MQNVTLIASVGMGIESIAANELKQLGYNDLTVENGKITIHTDMAGIARTNLWLRTVDRIRIKIGEFRVETFDELFEQTKALPWGEWISEDGQFPVSGKSHKSKLFSVSDVQAIVKKAIVESMKKHYKRESWFEETGALYRVEVSILKDIATLTIDSSGSGLHKRGYRLEAGEAPIRETMAAALVLLTNWTPDKPFVDPLCGSGTIPIEAALIGQNIAPGFNREFASEQWNCIDQSYWDKAIEEAEDLAKYDQPLDILGADIDHRMVELAKNNAIEAGLSDLIKWKQMQVKDLTVSNEYGSVVTNPPYGERLSDREKVAALYREMGKVYQEQLQTWSMYVITSNEDFEKHFGKKATKKRKLYNGPIKTDYYQYWGPRPPRV